MNILAQLGRFGIIGLLNTLITLIVIAIFTWLEATPFVANSAGYAAGFVNSYFGNMQWTFKTDSSWKRSFRFFVAFAGCYFINLAVLHFALPLQHYQLMIPQLVAMASYTISFFFLSRTWVFR